MDLQHFKEKYGPAALVTGASSGIGKAFAEQLAERGFDLVLIARRRERLETVQSDLQSRFGVKVFLLVQDLSERDAVEKIYQQTLEAGLEIGLLINNAGYGSYGEFDALNLDSELAMIDLACRSIAAMAYCFIPELKRRKRGGIIFVSSVLSQIPTPFMATYAACKTFEYAFANALHGELKPYGVDVLALLPGTTRTEFFGVAKVQRDFSFPSATPQHVARTALRAIGKKPYVVDGIPNKMLVFMARFIPIRWMIPWVRLALGPQ